MKRLVCWIMGHKFDAWADCKYVSDCRQNSVCQRCGAWQWRDKLANSNKEKEE